MKEKLKCILLIDDNEDDNNYNKAIIEESGIAETVMVAENGLQAMIFLTKENQMQPDLIFLDINMPKMNGWEFLEAYKNIEKKTNNVIVMLTMSQSPDDKKRAEGIKEIVGYQTKPMSAEGLNQIIEKNFKGEKPQPEKINILLVEDNPADSGLVDEYLQEIYNKNYTLTICDYVKKAIDQLKEKSFDIILSDLTLPDSSGLDTFTTIFKTNTECPIIILTGLNDEDLGNKAVTMGAQDYLVKNNVTAASLKHSIAHSLERYRLIKALVESSKILEKKTTDLLRKQQQFEEAQKIAHIGSWEWDITANTISWSDELYRIYGWEPQHFIPTSGSATKYIHPEDKDLVNKVTAAAYKEKKPFAMYYRIIDSGGKELIVREEARPITAPDGTVIKMYGTLQDMTEQKKMEDVTKAKEVAEGLTNAKDKFLATMSHELRTPLNSIIGFTKLLLKNDITEKQKKQLQAVKSSSDILLVLINDILDLSKHEADKILIEETDLDLIDLIKTVSQGLQLRFEEKELKVTEDLDSNIPKILRGDPVRIEQIFLNLLSNALKFTAKGGQINISAKVHKEDDKNVSIKFGVSDTGIGIAEDKIEHIFEPFSEASRSTARKYGGTGLGLSIVKRLVELMGGTIAVKSVVNEGCTFTFTLPLKRSEATIVAKESKALLRSNELKEIGSLKILLAEDTPINQFLIEEIMLGFNFKVDTAENGKIVIELLEKNDYDIILMDLMMPEMDGFEATRYIRNKMEPPKSKIPIIALTADVNKHVVVKCHEAGMDDYILKPFNEVELLNKMSRLVKKFRSSKNEPSLEPVK